MGADDWVLNVHQPAVNAGGPVRTWTKLMRLQTMNVISWACELGELDGMTYILYISLIFNKLMPAL